jgi:DNA polymerase elongation subunit (family B)
MQPSGIGSRSSSVALANDISAKIRQALEDVNDLENGMLIGAGYDGDRRLAFLKFYDVNNNLIRFYFDRSGHKPYCYSKLPPEELRNLKQRPDVEDILQEEKKDLINDRNIVVSKIITKDPLAIGGGGNNSIREIIPAYEADIKYYENYIYDKQLQMGAYFRVKEGRLEQLPYVASSSVMESLQKNTEGANKMLADYIRDWGLLLTQPYPMLKRAALDIEVYSPEENRLPDPERAEYPVISAALVGNDGKKRVFVLERSEVEKGESRLPRDVTVLRFRSEGELLLSLFDAMLEYPIIVTFNGDGFDLPYLYHRADQLEIQKDAIPISMGRDTANIKHGLHIDLYKAFNNRSIQIYAFSNKYSDHTLNGIASALLGREKVELEEGISLLSMSTLAYYNYTDAEITLELTTFNNDLVMRLFLTISRISKMPLEDACRLNVSNWIKSLLIWEHRKWNALVPRKDDLEAKGSASSEAIIKGKKYKGGLVIEPLPGVHFNAVVLDFASLYPSIIKVYNLSYETVNCVHPECRTNRIPETDHWVCRLRTGITSLLIGSLRDVRVGHFKNLSKKLGISKQEKEFLNVISQSLKVFLNACFTGDTYILTTQGVKNIKDVNVGDRVINVNPQTLKAEIDEVVETQSFPYDGELYHFDDGRFTDLVVTPNHRILVKGSDGTGAGAFVRADKVYSTPGMTIPARQGAELGRSEKISLLEYAKRVSARLFVTVYPSSLPVHRIACEGVYRYDSNAYEKGKGCESPVLGFELPIQLVDEPQIDLLESIGFKVMAGTELNNAIPVRLDTHELARFCAFFIKCGRLDTEDVAIMKRLVLTSPSGRGGHSAEQTGIPVKVCGDWTGTFSNPSILPKFEELVFDLKGGFVGDEGQGTIKMADFGGLGVFPASLNAGQARFTVRNPVIFEWLKEQFYGDESNRLDGRPSKIPNFILGYSNALQEFMNGLAMDNGLKDSGHLSMDSYSLAEGMAVVLGLAGYSVKIEQNEKGFSVIYSNSESVLTSEGAEPEVKNVTKVNGFKGTVYCLTTAKNHTVFAGRNGKFVPVGQSYGVMGFESFALYCLPVAEATAALGRYSITKTIEKARSVGIQVAYGDTDSLFLKSPTKEQVDEMLDWAKKELGIELEIDKVYRYAAFSGRKKNYLGVYPDGSVEVKGLTGKKSNVPEFIKAVFKQVIGVLAEVQTPEDFERAREKIRELLRKTYLDLKARKIPIDQLAFHVMMNKPLEKYTDTTPQHVKAAQILKERGKEIKSGEIISFVKTTGGTGVKPVEFTKPEDVDVDKYVEYLRGTFDQLLDALGYEFDEILGARKLEDFFFG